MFLGLEYKMLEIELKQVIIIEIIVLVILSAMSFYNSDFPTPLIAIFSIGFLFRFFLYWFLSEEENVKK